MRVAGRRWPLVTRRELERWVADNAARLATNGIRVNFSFGASSEKRGGASWASFLSRFGSGRLIRRADGSSDVAVYGFTDGSCLRAVRSNTTTAAQLEEIAGLILGAGAAVRP